MKNRQEDARQSVSKSISQFVGTLQMGGQYNIH